MSVSGVERDVKAGAIAAPALRKGGWRYTKRVMQTLRQGVVDRSPPWLDQSIGPAIKRLDMLLVDHGIFRLLYLNKHPLGARAWRSAQPAPHQIRVLARQGVRTIINLRGARMCGSYWLERSTCARHGITLIDFQVGSRAAPTREQIAAAKELFERVEYPILLHCKSGADRVGLMSVLYRHLKEEVPLDEARRELSLRFGHIRQADTGILDRFFEVYLADNQRQPMPFLEWVNTIYDPVELKRSFRSTGWARRLVDDILRRE